MLMVFAVGIPFANLCAAAGLEDLCGTYIYKLEHSSEYEIPGGREMERFKGISNNAPVRVMLHGNRKLFFVYPMPGGSYRVKGIDLIPEDHCEGRIVRAGSGRATSGVHMLGWNGAVHSRKRIYRDWNKNLVLDSKVKQWQVLFFMPVPLPNIEETAIKLIRADKKFRDRALDAFIRSYDFDADPQNQAPPPPANLSPDPADPYANLKNKLFIANASYPHPRETEIKKLLEQNPDFARNNPDFLFECPISPYYWRFESYRVLLEHGFDVNWQSKDGTPLLVFVAAGKNVVYPEEILPLMLRRNAGVNASDNLGFTALHWAGSPAQVQMLLDAGADAGLYNSDGERPFDTWIARRGDLDTARLLIDSIPGGGPLGNTPCLIHAANFWNAELIRLLLSRGADINSTDKRGWTALHGIASIYGLRVAPEYREPLDLLLEAGAAVDVPAPDGTTPLLLAVAANNFTVAEQLVKRGANLDAVNNRGLSPREEARLRGNKLMKQLLKK